MDGRINKEGHRVRNERFYVGTIERKRFDGIRVDRCYDKCFIMSSTASTGYCAEFG